MITNTIPCKTIIDQLPLLIWVAKPDNFTVEYYNAAWHEYTGLSEEDMKHGWEGAVHPNDIEVVNEAMELATNLRKPFQIELRLLRASDNEYHWFLSKCTPVFVEGKLEGWVGTSIDINDVKKSIAEKEEKYNQDLIERKSRIAILEEELARRK